MKKVFLIFLLPIVFMLVLFSNSNCFACDLSVLPPVFSEHFNSETDLGKAFEKSSKYVLFRGSSIDIYYLYFGDSEISIISKENEPGHVYCIAGSGTVYCVWHRDSDNYTSCGVGSFSDLMSHDCIIVSSNFDVKDNDSGEVFFKPPQGTLAPVVAQVTLGTVLEEVLGILPIVLVTIAGLIGLRKALALLFRTLRQS